MLRLRADDRVDYRSLLRTKTPLCPFLGDCLDFVLHGMLRRAPQDRFSVSRLRLVVQDVCSSPVPIFMVRLIAVSSSMRMPVLALDRVPRLQVPLQRTMRVHWYARDDEAHVPRADAIARRIQRVLELPPAEAVLMNAALDAPAILRLDCASDAAPLLFFAGYDEDTYRQGIASTGQLMRRGCEVQLAAIVAGHHHSHDPTCFIPW